MVRVLIAPPISPRTAEISGERRQIPCIGAFRRVNLVSGFLARCLHRRYGRSVSAPKNHFSWETETDLTRDWFESGHTAPRLTAVIRPSRLMGIGLLAGIREKSRGVFVAVLHQQSSADRHFSPQDAPRSSRWPQWQARRRASVRIARSGARLSYVRSA
jgi:hypothetical protein